MINSKSESGSILWYDLIPISVNDTYGDPFIIEQVDNTIDKLQKLYNHKAPVAIFTKAPMNEIVIEKLFKTVANHPKVVVYYSLTGLDEGGYSFETRVRMIHALEEVFNHVVILTRPIIRGKNDNIDNLKRIVNVASNTKSRLLVLGGLHDKYKNKHIEFSVEEMLIQLCDEVGVRTFHKTSCCAAYIFGESCWMHELNEPKNLDVAAELGYKFEVGEDRIVLNETTTGDLNFLRMLTRAKVFSQKIISNYNLLTLKTGEVKYEATSSWFAWSENIDTCLDCNYCIIKQIEYLKKMKVKIGTHPSEMVDIVRANNNGHDFSAFRLTKLRKDTTDMHEYADVRITKPCFVKRYDSFKETAISIES